MLIVGYWERLLLYSHFNFEQKTWLRIMTTWYVLEVESYIVGYIESYHINFVGMDINSLTFGKETLVMIYHIT